MNPRITLGDRVPTDPLPTAPPVKGSSPDAATPDARAPEDHARSPLSSRLSSALARLFPRDASSGLGRVAADGAAAYQEALRQAFRSAAPLEPARATPRSASEPEAARETVPAAPEPSEPELRPPLVASTPRALAPASQLPSFSPVGGPAANAPAGSSARSSGRTAPDDLLQVPVGVTTAADDFFGGLVRRVERHP